MTEKGAAMGKGRSRTAPTAGHTDSSGLVARHGQAIGLPLQDWKARWLHFAEAEDALEGDSSDEQDYADDDHGEEQAHGAISG